MAETTPSPIPSFITLPVAALWTVLVHAEREHSRLVTWLDLGAHETFSQDATELVLAITIAARTITHGPRTEGSSVALPVPIAATLRYYAGRELSRLRGMGAWFGDDDLDQQATELKEALSLIPFTLWKEDPAPAPTSAALHSTSARGEAVHG